ncbi:MAG: hypothetical protein S4CHLAM123_08880 [Chlamydiales bacterium]|nr:hypothetical protein [Chlamydiales bacterium]
MSDSGAIGGSPKPPEEIPGVGKLPGVSSGSIKKALDTPVKNLGQLKAELIKNLGKKDGLKVFNGFMHMVTTMMLQQMQSAAKQAQQAAKNMKASNK